MSMNAKQKTILAMAAYVLIISGCFYVFGRENGILAFLCSLGGVFFYIAGAADWGWTWMFDGERRRR